MPRGLLIHPATEGLALQPTLDNKVLTQFPLDAIKNGSAKDIPLLIGTNLDAWRLMAAMDPNVAKLDQDELRHGGFMKCHKQ